MTIRQVSKGDYDIRRGPQPQLYQELAWYATADNKVIGVVIRDRVDNDFSWVVLTENDQGPGYTGVDLATSIATEEEAIERLHLAMATTPVS